MVQHKVYREAIQLQSQAGVSQHRPSAHQLVQEAVRRSRPGDYQLPDDGRKWRVQCVRPQRLTLYLAGYRDCYPGLNRIAHDLGWSRRTVCVVMAQLKQLGVMVPLEYVHQRGTRRRVLNPKPLLESCTPASRESCTQELPRKFHNKKAKTEKVETLTRPVSSEQVAEDTWEKPTGFDVPDRDVASVRRVLEAKGCETSDIPDDFLAFVMEKVWLRAARPARWWKAYYAEAVSKILRNDKAYHGALHNWEERTRLYAKWFQNERKNQMPDDDLRTAKLSPLTISCCPAEMSAVIWALTHPDGEHLDTRVAQALTRVHVDHDSEFGLFSFFAAPKSVH